MITLEKVAKLIKDLQERDVITEQTTIQYFQRRGCIELVIKNDEYATNLSGGKDLDVTTIEKCIQEEFKEYKIIQLNSVNNKVVCAMHEN